MLPSAAFAGRITVKTDARLELAGIVQLLASEGKSPDGFAKRASSILPISLG